LAAIVRTIVINTGTEILLGDVLNTHLTYLARELLQFGLRIDEQRTIPDGDAIRSTLVDVFPRADLVFVTGGLGPTSDDLTREIVADLLQLPLEENAELRSLIHARLTARRIPTTQRIWRQAQVPVGGQVVQNDFGSAPGIYLPAKINPTVPSPHLFLLPGPPRELQPMFRKFVIPILRGIAPSDSDIALRRFRLANIGESIIERKVGAQLLAIPGLEIGYCARPGEVDLRVSGTAKAVAAAEQIIRSRLADVVFTTEDEDLAKVVVRLLTERGETLALAESCTGGFLSDQITNVPGASRVFLAGHVTYSNDEKVRVLGVQGKSLQENGAVSEEVAREMAEGTRASTQATHAIATTGIAGPTGGTGDKPVGTVFVALASTKQPTLCEKSFFPTDRATFKEIVAQRAFDLLRKRLLAVSKASGL
jgi:nicotinamide-nucleotide amidase